MRKRDLAMAGCGLLAVLILGLTLWNALSRTTHIQLPERPSQTDGDGSGTNSTSALQTVSVTPETVQAAVATLSRPDSYRRTLTVERYWTGGHSSSTVSVCVSDGWTRTDSTAANGVPRHVLTDGVTTYIWYGDGLLSYTGAAGQISADDEQGIPVYEDLLALPTEEITAADYRSLSGVDCIYAETTASIRYWISVETGLLAAAEQLTPDTTTVLWRVTGLTLSDTPPTAEDFTLPNGTVLIS